MGRSFSKSGKWLQWFIQRQKGKTKFQLEINVHCFVCIMSFILHASASTIYVTAAVLGFSFWLLRFILNEKDESYYLSSFVFTGLHCVKIYGTLEVYKNWTLCVEACLL